MDLLTDSYGRVHNYLRISVTDRCNLRCAYCMPAEGIHLKDRKEILSYEEMTRVVRIFTAMGVSKVRITGGEPTVRNGITGFVTMLRRLPELKTIAMTTNGLTLKNDAEQLKRSGLDALNISLDTLKPDRFLQITGYDRLSDTLDGIESAIESGFSRIKINTVIMSGVNDDEVFDFIEFVKDKAVDLRFIEYMPFQGNGWNKAGCVAGGDILTKIRKRFRIVPLPGGSSGSAFEFTVRGSAGTIGLITPISSPFCESCNRIRLTADGGIKPCLLLPVETSIRTPLRTGVSDSEIAAMVRLAVMVKPVKHLPAQKLLSRQDRSMVEIGG